MGKQWNYLASNALQMRYMTVAGLLRNFDNILEVGSYKTPLFKFINDKEKNIIALDPLAIDGSDSDCQNNFMVDYRCFDSRPFFNNKYALVLVGLDMPLTQKMFSYIKNAELVVIEFTEDNAWKKSREIYDKLKHDLKFTEFAVMHFDFDGNDFTEFSKENDWPPRVQRYLKVVSAKHDSLDMLGQLNPFVKPIPLLDASNSQLLNSNFLRDMIFPEADFEFSHGACRFNDYAGGGLLYYTLAYMLRAKTCVCLGSGGGFVPRLLRQAQRDIGMHEISRTILVDGNKGSFGRPNWLNSESFFKKNYNDIDVIVADTVETSVVLRNQGVQIDYLHIDADHSYEGSLNDFKSYLPIMKKNSLVTFHDTKLGSHDSVTCGKALDDIRGMGFEVINMPFIASGVAIIVIP